MLAKKNRLKIQDYIALKPKKIHRGRFLLIKVYPENDNIAQIGVSVGKKIFSSAAKRNQLKRKIFNSIAEELPRFAERKLIIQALPSIKQADYHAIIKELFELLKN